MAVEGLLDRQGQLWQCGMCPLTMEKLLVVMKHLGHLCLIYMRICNCLVFEFVHI